MKIFSAETALFTKFLNFHWLAVFFASKLVGTIRTTKSEKAERKSGLLLHNNFIAHAHQNKNFSSRELFV